MAALQRPQFLLRHTVAKSPYLYWRDVPGRGRRLRHAGIQTRKVGLRRGGEACLALVAHPMRLGGGIRHSVYDPYGGGDFGKPI